MNRKEDLNNLSLLPIEELRLRTDPEALCLLGKYYREGVKVKKDEKTAVEYYQRATALGSIEAEVALGDCFLDGLGVEKNSKKALEHYQNAANRGNCDAIYNVGALYYNGNGVEQDFKKAFECFQKVAKREEYAAHRNATIYAAYATFALGQYHQYGIGGIQKDLSKAFDFYLQSAKAGYASAQRAVGICYEKGSGVNADNSEAFRWYSAAAEAGDSEGCCSLARCYDQAIGVSRDAKKAEKWFRESAGKNYANGQAYLAFYLLKEDPKNNEAFRLMNEAAKNGDERAKLYIKDKIFFDTKDKIEKIRLESKDYFLPEEFPPIVDQTGPYCGSAAFAGAANYAQGKKLYASEYEKRYKPIPASEPGTTILDKLKTTYSTNGSQFSVHSFSSVAKFVGVQGGEALVMDPNITEEQFRATICDALKNNYALVLACDACYGMPAQNEGYGTHWVFAFGYWSDKNKDYKIVVTHHGMYCEWSLHDLYLSNKQLPEKNPCAYGNLKQFKFSMFKIPITSKIVTKESVPEFKTKLSKWNFSDVPTDREDKIVEQIYGRIEELKPKIDEELKKIKDLNESAKLLDEKTIAGLKNLVQREDAENKEMIGYLDRLKPENTQKINDTVIEIRHRMTQGIGDFLLRGLFSSLTEDEKSRLTDGIAPRLASPHDKILFSNLPYPVWEIIRRLFHSDPNESPSLEEIECALEKILAGQPKKTQSNEGTVLRRTAA